MQIQVEVKGRMIPVDCDMSSTIQHVKLQIERASKIKLNQQKLLFMGNVLRNDRSLAYYNIQDMASLVLEQQATPRQFWISMIYFSCFVALGLFMGSPGPILQDLQIQTSTNLAVISYVFSARAIGYVIGSVLFGLLSDRYASHYAIHGRFSSPILPFRPHHLFGLCLFVLALCVSTVPYIHNIEALTMIISVSGICCGGIDCFGNVLLLCLYDTDNEHNLLVAPYMQFLHFSFAIGAFLSPLLIQISFVHFGGSYATAFWIMSSLAVLSGAILLFIPTPLRSKLNQNQNQSHHQNQNHNQRSEDHSNGHRHTEDTSNSQLRPRPHHPSISILSGDRRAGSSQYGSFNQSGYSESTHSVDRREDGLSPSDSSIIGGPGSRSKRRYRIMVILCCALFLGVYVGSEVAYGAYITTYSVEYLWSTPTVGRYLSSVFWGGLSCGRLSAVWIARKLKPLHMLVLDLVGCFAAAAVLFVMRDNENAVWVASVLYGVFMASIFPCIFLVAEHAVRVDGRLASIMIFGASVGEFIIPTAEGNLMGYFGVQYFSWITMGLVVMLFFLLLILCILIYLKGIKRKVSGFFAV